MKKNFLFLVIIMIFALISCVNSANNNVDAIFKECSITVEPGNFSLSVGTWDQITFNYQEDDFERIVTNGLNCLEIPSTEPDSTIKIKPISMSMTHIFKSEIAYNEFLTENPISSMGESIEDSENLTITINIPQEKNGEYTFPYKKYLSIYETEGILKTNSDRTKYIYTTEGVDSLGHNFNQQIILIKR